MDAPEKIDYNALDNTFGGQLIQAGFILAIYAAGDLPRRTGLTRAGLVAGNIAAIGVFNAFDEDPANDLTAVVSERGSRAGGPAATWALIGGLAGAGLGAAALAARAHRAAARALARRGVGAPWTLIGALAAGGYLAVKAIPSRR
ncbi:hypothetical protein [Corynebacterium auris]|uniref:hypothetical protein n=1 Tax=Corynebacterium auris TaxID=44750 RepID=UPI0025B4CD04|nr:hypothetical protein [Corynebacterium auris]WJY67072.1 hypothetical protein CAURIS_00620 [Corynebacterium auris]